MPFNIASYALLTHMVAQVTGLEVGDFVHTLGDAHLYANHLDQARLQLTREPRPLPTLRLDPSVTETRRLRPRAHRRRGLRPAPGHQGAHRRHESPAPAGRSLVAAVADNGVIGDGGRHPVAHPRGLRALQGHHHGQHTLVMGRATYDSIGRPLPGRTTIVLTRDPDWRADGVLVAHALEEALDLAAAQLDGDVMVVGGAQVYAAGAAARHPPGAHRGAPRRPTATRTTRRSTGPSGARPGARSTTGTPGCGWSESALRRLGPHAETRPATDSLRRMTSGTLPPAPFGRVLTAMVTAFHDDGSVDLDGHRPGRRAPRRPRPRRGRGLRHDGGVADHHAPRRTAGSCARSSRRSATGCKVVAGVGTNNTAHSVELAAQAEKVGADGVLLVTPYYNKPTQAGRGRALRGGRRRQRPAGDALRHPGPHRHHDRRGDLPRGSPQHDRIVAVKDAVGDLFRGVRIMADTGLAFYSGDDVLNLGWLTHGGCGIVSVVGHVAGDQYAHDGRRGGPRRPGRPPWRPTATWSRSSTAIMTTAQGAMTAKAALRAPGRASQPQRPAPARARRRRPSWPTSAPCWRPLRRLLRPSKGSA